MIVYDGRVSARCAQECVDGVCGQPLVAGIACGGCCGCLGGCREGYSEQCIEEYMSAPVRWVTAFPAEENGEDSPDRH